jgi:hypothetical protein
MPVHLAFYSPLVARPHVIGPAPWFRVAGNFVRQGPHGSIVGTFRYHHWELQSQHFIRFEVNEPVLVHFEDAAGGASEDFGPFAKLSSVDGVMRVGEGDLFAKFVEDTQLWHCYRTENFWPAIVIKADGAVLRKHGPNA